MPQPYPHGELVIVIDCADLGRSAAFWSAALGYTASPASRLEPAPGRVLRTSARAAEAARLEPGPTAA